MHQLTHTYRARLLAEIALGTSHLLFISIHFYSPAPICIRGTVKPILVPVHYSTALDGYIIIILPAVGVVTQQYPAVPALFGEQLDDTIILKI